MRIEELHLKNFRCFKELDIQFPKSNLAVFIGLNGAGKSAILDAISLLLSSYKKSRSYENYKKDNKTFGEADDLHIGASISESESKIRFNSTIEWKASINKNEISEKITTLKPETPITEQEYRDTLISQLTDDNAMDNMTEYLTTIGSRTEPPPVFLYRTTDKKEDYIFILDDKLFFTDFDDFTEWFEREENIEGEDQREKNSFEYTNPKLDIIRVAIKNFFKNISNADFDKLKTKRNKVNKAKDYLSISHNKKDMKDNWKELKLSQLAAGQKLLILLVCNIARQIVETKDINYAPHYILDDAGDVYDVDYINDLTKEEIDDFLKTSGVVLIDEIELHLHPQWQREVLPALQKTFPNIQFIVTTHSPQVLSRVHRDDIFILKDNKLYQPSSNPIGRDSSDILDEIMDITKRPDDIQKLSDDYFLLLAKNELEESSKIRIELDKMVEDKKLDKDDPIFYRANGILARKQLLKK